jgi:putative membrane-bound dehydrogenase-like protein
VKALLAVFPAFALLANARAEVSPTDALQSFQLADDSLRIELVAAEPLVESPCAMAFDERGRLFVAENRGYPNMATPPQGHIAMLEDVDGDGRMDKRTTFADGLTFPNGVIPWRGGLIVTCAPDVLYFKDIDADGKADERKALLTGFATSGSTQLRVNCPTLGPDGWIYFAAGLSGGNITGPEYPERPALKMTGDLRWQPFTGEFENVDGRSQYGMSFDDYGRRFICMNRVPVQHVVLSSKVLARNPRLAFSETVQDCSERTVKTGLRGGGDGVRLFPISQNITTADSHAGSFSAACGIMIWRGGALPEKYRGCAFTCDPTANLVHVDRLEPRGATFAATPMFEKEQREFLASRDDWFRPVFLTSGPDGALYICDMYRKTIEHPDYLPEEVRKRTDFESGKEMGRIWRVSKASRADAKSPGIPADSTAAQLVAAFRSYDGWTRDTAFRLIFNQDRADAVAALTSGLDRTKPVATILALRALQLHGSLESSMIPAEVADPEIGSVKANEAVNDAVIQLLGIQEARRTCSPFRGLNEERFALIVRNNGGQPVNKWMPTPTFRLRVALALADEQDAVARAVLADIAIANADDKWFRAAVLSSSANREWQLLKAILARLPDSAAAPVELLSDLGTTIGAGTAPGAASEAARDLITLSESRYFSVTLPLLAGFASRAPSALGDTSSNAIEYVVQQALRVLASSTDSIAQRIYACVLLGQTSFPRAGGPLLQIALGDLPIELRHAAIRALSSFGDSQVSMALLDSGRWLNFTPGLREAVLGALVTRDIHLPGILAAMENGALPASALTSQQRAIFLKHKNPAIRERAEKLFGTASAGDRAKAFEEAKAALGLAANGEHGREVFKTHCAICHRLEREGVAVGPDLLDMRNQPKESILFHLIVPDAEIAPAFSTYLAETKDGRTLSGVLVSETATSVQLRMASGAEETLLRTQLAKLEALPNSLMPAGLEAAMSQQDLADLLAFLKGER